MALRVATLVQRQYRQFAHFTAIDARASSQRAREPLGWQPKRPVLIADLDRGRYLER